jgi:hypothetical protein
MRSALIIIDVQQGMFALPMPPWSGGMSWLASPAS